MLEFIDKLDGNRWEELCDSCYRKRYQKDNYQYIPAEYQGDCGIEGYTKTGITYQCYYPEKDYNDDELYEHLRKKMTTDVKKLIDNEKRLKAIGVDKVIEWHFVIPEYRDKRILEHAEKKRKEVLEKKKQKKLDYISKDFKIIVKVKEDFREELYFLIKTEKDYKLDLALKHTRQNIDWKKCDSDKVKNIERKIRSLLSSQNSIIDEDKLNELVNLYVDYYLKGIELFNTIQDKLPEQYEDLVNIEYTYGDDIKQKCLSNNDKTCNKSIFDEIIRNFEKDLKEEYKDLWTMASIKEIKNDLIGKWLAECPLSFVE